jgi:Plasmid pRiA4b ORF-3-like protein
MAAGAYGDRISRIAQVRNPPSIKTLYLQKARPGRGNIDARGVRLDSLNLRCLERFLYEYDFGDGWIHELRLEATLPVDPRKTYPRCVAGKCSAPPEDCGGPSAFMENRHYYAGVRRGSLPDLDDFIDEFDDDEAEGPVTTTRTGLTDG